VLKSQLFVDKFTETVHHTFLEYLASGFELNFMVAIDFTGMYCTTVENPKNFDWVCNVVVTYTSCKKDII